MILLLITEDWQKMMLWSSSYKWLNTLKMHPHGDKEDFTRCNMGTLSIGDEVEVMVEEEEEEGIG